MNRRSFLALGAAGLTLTARRHDGRTAGSPLPAQDTVPTSRRAVEPPSQADRLYDPSVVQERSPATPLDNDPAIKDLEHRLKCTCGCNLDIYTCRTTDFTCTYSPALHREVLALWESGTKPDQIVDAFVAKYGESILMAPKPEGFNLAGYLVPGILVAAAALLLAWILVRRSQRAPEPASRAAEPPSRRADAVEDERLRQALADLED